LRKIKGKHGGSWQKCHLLPPSNQNREGGGAGMAGWQGRPPAAPAAAAAGEQGKTERGTRGFFPRAHLGLECTVEAAPREGSDAAAALGGDGAVVLGEEGRRCCETAVVRCSETGRPSALFIGGGWRFGEEIFPRRAPLRRVRGASRGGDRRCDSSCCHRSTCAGRARARGRLRSGR
jgi:hypothetical protein